MMPSIFEPVGNVVDRIRARAHHDKHTRVTSKGADKRVRLATSAAAVLEQMVSGGGVKFCSKVDGRIELRHLQPVRLFDGPGRR